MKTAPLLRLTNISKSFGGWSALEGVSLDVRAGEILCLLGDNGAGKSTLIKILAGVHRPTSGTLEMNGKPTSFSSPKDASTFGIATVHQFGGSFPLMTVARSFFVGMEPTIGWGPLRRFDKRTAAEIAIEAVQGLGITNITSGEQYVGSLSGGERQALVIARAVHFGAKLLVLDEPTAALGVKEATHVLRIMMQARSRGVAVVFVTHSVVHAMTVGDRFAVLIHGEKVADFRKGERDRAEITDLMAGGEAIAELELELEQYRSNV